MRSFVDKKRGAILEGGARSGKTWSSIDFLIWVCASYPNKGLLIFLLKDTYAGFKTTLYDDFNRRLPDHGLPSPFTNVKEINSFYLFGNKIMLVGADQPEKFQSAGCDMFYANEALPIRKETWKQIEMRCRLFWWCDYNPMFTDHWLYDFEKREEVTFCRSTMLDNPDTPEWQRKTILSYEPTDANMKAGTADDYLWNVYGLGLRSSPQGLIFPNVQWIDRFPDDVSRTWFGLDFGYTNDPTALVKIGVNGNDVYLEEQLYRPIDNAGLLIEVLTPIVHGSLVWADSADPQMIKDMQKAGIKCFPVKKFPGSIQHGIDVMKRYRLNIVRSVNFKKEAENYKWREINGISLNEPVDEFNHLWDASRYGCQMELAKRAGFTV